MRVNKTPLPGGQAEKARMIENNPNIRQSIARPFYYDQPNRNFSP